MDIKNKISVLFFFLFCLTSQAFCQTTNDTAKATQIVLVKMKNGDEFKGQIISKDDKTIVLKTENGEMNLLKSNVTSIENNTYTGNFKFPSPNDSRYFMSPTGIPIKSNTGYYQNVLLTFNFVSYGFTKNFSIGGGLEFVSTLLGHPIWFLTPRLGFDLSENVHAAGGLFIVGLSTAGTASLAYGALTLGTSESNLTFSMGYGYFDGELSSYPAIMICGTHRLGKSIALLSENYFISDSYNTTYLGIQGIRILSEKNSFDIGAIIIPEISREIPALPFVGYTRKF